MEEKINKNPIVEVYKGVPIRKYPRIYLRLSIYEMKRVIDANIEKGLCAKNAIKANRVFCNPCIDPSFKKYTP